LTQYLSDLFKENDGYLIILELVDIS